VSNGITNLGIIACGDVAFRTYIPGIQAVAERATVVAAFDPLAERAERAAALFPNATAYTTLEEFLAHPGLEGVFNLTPAPFHRETNARALDAGLHVFSEKPLAASVAECQALIAHAGRAGNLLLCAPAVMVTDRFRWIKRLIQEGQIGAPTLATAQMANMGPAGWSDYTGDPGVFYKKGVGPLLDIGVYSLHGITGIFGPAKRVQAFGGIAIPERTVTIPRFAGQTVTVETNDHMLLHLDFGANRFAQILASFAVPASRAPSMEFHATGGSVSIAMESWYAAAGGVDVFRREATASNPAGWERSVPPDGNPDEHLIGAGPRHFAGVIRGEEAPVLTAEHATHVLEIMLKAQESTTAGCALELATTF